MTVPTLECSDITDITAAGVFSLGNRTVSRMGYGAMQLAGPGVFGPPKDRHAARLWYCDRRHLVDGLHLQKTSRHNCATGRWNRTCFGTS